MPDVDLSYMPENTRWVFEQLETSGTIKNFVLVGGTALAIQTGHRKSEDLGFIYDGDNLPVPSLKRNIAKTFPHYKIIRQDEKWQIDIIINDVKVTFFTTGAITLPFNLMSHSFRLQKANVCPVNIIASLKMAAIAQRNTMRDYYDLYWISKYNMPLIEIIKQTKHFIPGLAPITYTETLIYTKDIAEKGLQNHLEPIEDISKEEIAEYFVNELKRIKNRII